MSAKFQIFKGTNSQHYFHLKAANGEIVLASEGYTSEHNCRAGIDSVKINSMLDSRYKKLSSAKNEAYFTLHASNGQVIGTSEMYSSTQARDHGIEVVKKHAANAPIEQSGY